MRHLLPMAVVSNPHFQRLGGEPAVRRLVTAFYGAMDRLPQARAIRALHAPDLAATQDVLVLYLCEWLGGPKRYTAERGAPRLGRVHAPFALDSAAADAWMHCMADALERTCADAALRHDLLAAFDKVARHLSDPVRAHRGATPPLAHHHERKTP